MILNGSAHVLLNLKKKAIPKNVYRYTQQKLGLLTILLFSAP
jgi:hypothetical protein